MPDTLLVDTASANTWIGAGQAYVQTGSSVQTADTVVRLHVWLRGQGLHMPLLERAIQLGIIRSRYCSFSTFYAS